MDAPRSLKIINIVYCRAESNCVAYYHYRNVTVFPVGVALLMSMFAVQTAEHKRGQQNAALTAIYGVVVLLL